MVRIIRIAAALAVAITASAQNAAGVRILMGLTDTESTKWDGSVLARGGEITAIEPWRFEGDDAIDGLSGWKASTHAIRLFNAVRPPLVANGVIVHLANMQPGARVEVSSTQGEFSFRLEDIPYGQAETLLRGRVMVDRVPAVIAITNDPEEQDYPAAAIDKNGTVWLAYLQFVHNKDHNRLRANFHASPKDFAELKAPPGGDQILVKSYRGGVWSEPIAISAAGGDLYRPAIAVDGSGKPWVFSSKNERGNFDLWARSIDNGAPGPELRITDAVGSDIDPAATTDSTGRVWVAWQAWRDGAAEIEYAVQEATGFSVPKPVSTSTANEWNPAIAADANGRVTIAWDSYRNGNYDIYMRTASVQRSGLDRWDKETPLAASPRYEAYPSLAYDSAGRLWCAYEEGGEDWGKDFGAYKSTGIALYQGRAVRIRGFAKGGEIVNVADPGALMPGAPSLKVEAPGQQNASVDWLAPDPNHAAKRRPNQASPNLQAPKNTLPRLLIDSSGRMWLAFRSVNPVWWNPIGSVWSEYVMSYDNGAWTAPIYLDHSDDILDNRPALVSTGAGELMIIGSSDGRRQFHRIEANDPYNNDLFANTIALPPGSGSPDASDGGRMPPVVISPAAKSERDAIARMRAYRLGDLHVVRGEFHRHSEISMDGANDGTLLDQWRYLIDAAGLDWAGCCDHDNGGGREYSWWIEQKLTDIFYTPGRFAPLFSYERSVPYPEGHRNVLFAQRGIRPLPRLLPRMNADSTGHAPDTQMLYAYLKEFHGMTAAHTSATYMGTDWRDNDPRVETSVEIYQGERQNYERPGAPRSNREGDSIGGYRPQGYVDVALQMGYKMAFEASSDHVSTHMSFTNVLATGITRQELMDAFRKRHLYASTSNIVAEFRSGGHIMGDAFSIGTPPVFLVKLMGTSMFAKVFIFKDNQYVYSVAPKTADVSFTWRDASPTTGKTSYYYVRGEQEDGEIVWVSPMWITYTGK